MRPTFLEINEENFKHNVREIRKLIKGKEMIPVIKADCYGTKINTRLDLIEEFNIVAVAMVEEGIAIRNIGFKGDILVLNQVYESFDEVIDNDLSVGVADVEYLVRLNQVINARQDINNKKVKVHIEIETGMNRTGMFLKDLDDKFTIIKDLENIEICGIYSHLSSADENKEYTDMQIKKFREAVEKAKEYFSNIKYIHIEASTGILNANVDFTNSVRPGIILYGYKAIKDQELKIDLKPVAKLKTKIVFLKELDEGEKISYSGTYTTERKSVIATIPIGYADGIDRKFSNNMEVFIDGKKAKVVGKICMDSFMVDVTDIEGVNTGHDVYIWDNENITLEEMAERIGTINYEIISRISERVHRIFVK